MSRRFILLPTVLCLVFWLTSTTPAANYHIGSSTTQDGVNYFDSLEELYKKHQALNNDTLIFYKSDQSLTKHTATQPSFTVNGTVNLRANIAGTNITIDGRNIADRLFYVTGTLNISDDFTFANFNSADNAVMTAPGNGAINANGVTYLNNNSVGGGAGAISTHWQGNVHDGYRTRAINARGAYFEGNSGNGGGAVTLGFTNSADFTDATFIDNISKNRSGGAIYAWDIAGTTTITLGASAGGYSLYQGNKDKDGNANSLYFAGGVWVDTGIPEHAYINVNIVTGKDGVLDMLDPIYMDGTNLFEAHLVKSGEGDWNLGGVTKIDTGKKIDPITGLMNQATLTIAQGTFRLFEGAEVHMTGNADKFVAMRGTHVRIDGGNTITGTDIAFDVGSNLAFDLNYYYNNGGHAKTTPMLNLSGTRLTVQGVRVDIVDIPYGKVEKGTYVLIQGDSPMTAGDFGLWVGGVDASLMSERFGYSLDNANPLQVALVVEENKNSVLTWKNYDGNGLWSYVDQNWDEPKFSSPTNIDSFIPGDSAVFNLSGNNTVTLTDTMRFSPQDGEVGMRVSGDGNWSFRGASLSDLHNPDIADSPKGTFLFDGSGFVLLNNDTANTWHGETIISGGGQLNVLRGDQLGLGGIRFRNDENNRLVVNGTTTLNQQLTVEANGRGTLTAAPGTALTVTVPSATGTVETAGTVEANGTLDLEGDIRFNGNLQALNVLGTVNATDTRFMNNGMVVSTAAATNTYGSAVQLAGQGTFNGASLRFSGNKALLAGGAVVQHGYSTAILQDSLFTTNEARYGGAWAHDEAAAATITGGVFRANKAFDDGGAVFVSSGSFTANGTLFEQNQATHGGALAMIDGNVDLTDSNFKKNIASALGGAVHYQAKSGSSLTLGASDGKTSLFSGNLAGNVANSVNLSGANGEIADVQIATAGSGELQMFDPMSGQAGDYTATITKTGAGSWSLAGHSVFNGDATTISIEEGTLQLYKANAAGAGIAAGQITIASGAFDIGADGTLAAQGGNAVTATDINLAAGATLAFDLSGYSKDNTALLELTATNWSVEDWDQNIDLLSLGVDAKGVYNLMTVNGEVLDVAKMELLIKGEKVSEQRTQSAKLLIDGTALQVEIDDKPSPNGTTVWTNKTGNGTWNATSKNWDGQDNGIVAEDISGTKQFLNGDAVIFDDLGAGTVTVNAGGVDIAPRGAAGNPNYSPGMIVNNPTADYTFIGGSIGGTGALLKQGDGTVTFSQTKNTFSGGTTIEGGTVVAKTVNSLGTGDIVTGNLNGKGTVQFDLANSGEFSRKISGTGDLVKSGAGDLTLSNSDNSYEGGTTIRGGKVIAKGVVKTIGTGPIDTGSGSAKGAIVFDLDQDDSFDNTISGTGSVEKSGFGTLTLNKLPPNKANSYSGGTLINDGYKIAVVTTDPTGKVLSTTMYESDTPPAATEYSDGKGNTVKETVLARSQLVAADIEALGTGDITNNGVLELDFGAQTSKDFTQLISGTGDLIKTGDNSLKLSRANTFSGTTTFDKGKLSIAHELALQNSTLNILGGTFSFETLTRAKLGGLSGTEAIDLTNDNGTAVALTVGNNGKDADYSGNLGGKGSLTKIGSGTQTLSGTNTYAGGTVVESGKLVAVGLDALGTGAVETNAILELNINGNETLTDAITGTGSVEKSGTGTLEYAVQNTYTGGTTVSAGTLKVSSFDDLGTGSVSVNLGGTLLVNLEKDADLSDNVSVLGTLTKTGSGTLTIDDNTVTGGTMNINAGGLYVNGTTQALTTIGKGAWLGGNGWIDNTVILQDGATQYVGARKSTGQSQFTARDFVYEGGSTIYVKVGKYGSDRIIAENGFDFAKGGGTVDVIFLSLDDFGGEELTTQYDVFTAENGGLTLNGTQIVDGSSESDVLRIDGVNGKVQFHSGDGELNVTGYEVKKEEAQRSVSVNLLATGGQYYTYLTDNQRTVLGAVGSAAVFDTFFKTGKDYRGDVLDQLMPTLQTAMPYVSERGVTQYNLATFERLRFLREPLGLDAEREPDYRGSSYRLMHRHGKRNYLWFQNFGDFLRTQADSHCTGLYSDGYGFSVGVDRGIDAHTVVGFGLGGYFAKVRTNDSLQNGEANHFLLSVYGSRSLQDDWTLSGSGGFSFNRYSIDRDAPSFGTTLESGHNGTSVFAAMEISRKFLLHKLEVTPYLDANWICLWEDGAREHANGNPALALNIDSQSTSSFLTTVGLRIGRSFRLLEKNIVNPSVYFGWVQDWGSGRIRTSASFPDEPVFAIRGASMHNNRGIVGLNLNMTLNGHTDLFARFNTELAERYSDMSMHWGIRFGF